MKTTFTLWQGLKKQPADHPLFQRVIHAPIQVMPWYMACAVIVVAPLLLIPAILFTSAFYSLRWAVSISGTIARERETGMFELIALSPAGAFGASWAACTASIHRNDSLAQIQSPSSWIVRLAFTLLILASLGNFVAPLVPETAAGGMLVIIPLVYLFTLSGALYIDHVQSIVTSALVGMLIPTYARGRVDAGGGAFLMFLLLQVTTYVLTLVLGFVLLPAVLETVGLQEIAVAFVLPVGRLVIFYVIRAILITILWRVLVERLNIAASELEIMTR